MKNCHEDMIAYHDEDVTLPHKDQDEMRERRNTNRRRLKSGLTARRRAQAHRLPLPRLLPHANHGPAARQGLRYRRRCLF